MATTNIVTVKPELTVPQVNLVIEAVTTKYDSLAYAAEREDFTTSKYATNPETGKYESSGERELSSWLVDETEKALATREQLRAVLLILTGEQRMTDSAAHLARARKALADEKAAKQTEEV